MFAPGLLFDLLHCSETEVTHYFTILPALVLQECVLIGPPLLHLSSSSKTGLNMLYFLALWVLYKITNPGIPQRHPRDWHCSLALSGTAAETVWTVPCSESARIAVCWLWWLNGYTTLDSVSWMVTGRSALPRGFSQFTTDLQIRAGL